MVVFGKGTADLHQMLQMAILGDSAKRTTVNFTVFHAGDPNNVIANAASVRGDMLATDVAEFDRVEQTMTRLAANKSIAGAEVTTRQARGIPPLPGTPHTGAPP
jgi:glutamate carboxypeptidase